MAYSPNVIVNNATVYPYQNRQLDTGDPGTCNVTEGTQQAALMKLVKADGTAVTPLAGVTIALPNGFTQPDPRH